MRWPPLALPSHIVSPLARLAHISHLILLAFSYLHLLALAFFYYYSGLTGDAQPERVAGAKWLGIRNVGSEPLGAFCRRHRIWRGMQEEVLEPLIAAVTTVGRDEVAESPAGEALGSSVPCPDRKSVV